MEFKDIAETVPRVSEDDMESISSGTTVSVSKRLRSGIDICDIGRVKAGVLKRGATFLDRIYTKAEQGYCFARSGERQWASLAARYAAKEAVAKALGTGLMSSGGVRFTDIEVCCDGAGAPYVNLSAGAAEVFKTVGGVEVSISLSHEADIAVASCVLLCEPMNNIKEVVEKHG